MFTDVDRTLQAVATLLPKTDTYSELRDQVSWSWVRRSTSHSLPSTLCDMLTCVCASEHLPTSSASHQPTTTGEHSSCSHSTARYQSPSEATATTFPSSTGYPMPSQRTLRSSTSCLRRTCSSDRAGRWTCLDYAGGTTWKAGRESQRCVCVCLCDITTCLLPYDACLSYARPIHRTSFTVLDDVHPCPTGLQPPTPDRSAPTRLLA